MTAQVENGRRVVVDHPSAMGTPPGAVVELPDKTTLAWFLRQRRAELPVVGDTIHFSAPGAEPVQATILAIGESAAGRMASALISISGQSPTAPTK